MRWPRRFIARGSRILRGMMLGGAMVLAALVTAWHPWRSARSPESATPGAAAADAVKDVPERSVAVLPFIDMSEKKDQAYLADGLPAELIDRLARISDLRVPARTSSFYFKDRPASIATIAQQLQVAHVLEGGVRRSGDRLRVTAQLIRADSGRRVWSESYDREVRGIFKIQDEIARAVVAALKVKLVAGHPASIARGTVDSDAYTEYLMGREAQRRAKSPDEWQLSISPLRKAIALDPGYAAAYAALAYSEASLADVDGDEAQVERAVVDADKAVLLGPDQVEGYSMRGYLRIHYIGDWLGAETDLGKALAVDAGSSESQRDYAALMATLGRLPDAVGAARKSVLQDPLAVGAWVRLGRYLTANGQYAAADAAIRRALALQPDNPRAFKELGTLRLVERNAPEALAAFRRMGRDPRQAAGIAMAQYLQGSTDLPVRVLASTVGTHGNGTAYPIAEAEAWVGASDAAFEWLNRAYRQRDADLSDVKFDPLLDRIRHDARYTALLRNMKLPE